MDRTGFWLCSAEKFSMIEEKRRIWFMEDDLKRKEEKKLPPDERKKVQGEGVQCVCKLMPMSQTQHAGTCKKRSMPITLKNGTEG